jgi:glycerol-3-phosphate dehydrogenase
MHYLQFDSVVVGGGICGQVVAQKLTELGKKVALLESKETSDDSASAKNHGIVHSGAMFLLRHPEVVYTCIKARDDFACFLPEYGLSNKRALYLLPKILSFDFLQKSKEFGIVAKQSKAISQNIFQSWISKCFDFYEIDELVLDSTKIPRKLWQENANSGVKMFTQHKVKTIDLAGNKLIVVSQNMSVAISAREVILTAGGGLHSLLKQFDPSYNSRIRSRVATMLKIDTTKIDREIVCLQDMAPVIVPRYNGTILASLYGATQPIQLDKSSLFIPMLANQVVSSLSEYFAPGVINWGTIRGYHCVKTDYLGVNSENGVSPHFKITNHSNEFGGAELWSILPGKWTFVFEAVRALLSAMNNSL